jgi:hypothetical protein
MSGILCRGFLLYIRVVAMHKTGLIAGGTGKPHLALKRALEGGESLTGKTTVKEFPGRDEKLENTSVQR